MANPSPVPPARTEKPKSEIEDTKGGQAPFFLKGCLSTFCVPGSVDDFGCRLGVFGGLFAFGFGLEAGAGHLLRPVPGKPQE